MEQPCLCLRGVQQRETVFKEYHAHRTCFIMRLLGHVSIAQVVPGALVDNAAPHERPRVPLQLQLLVKQSVCAAVGGARGRGGDGEVGAVSDDQDCSSCGR